MFIHKDVTNPQVQELMSSINYFKILFFFLVFFSSIYFFHSMWEFVFFKRLSFHSEFKNDKDTSYKHSSLTPNCTSSTCRWESHHLSNESTHQPFIMGRSKLQNTIKSGVQNNKHHWVITLNHPNLKKLRVEYQQVELMLLIKLEERHMDL